MDVGRLAAGLMIGAVEVGGVDAEMTFGAADAAEIAYVFDVAVVLPDVLIVVPCVAAPAAARPG